MAKPACFVSIHHKQPGEIGSVKDLLKYLQHRTGSVRREAYLSGEYKDWKAIPKGIRDQALDARKKWTDRGLGSDRKEILERLENWQGRQVMMRYWVVSPDPHLMQHVPEDKRLEMVARITDATVHDLYEANGWVPRSTATSSTTRLPMTKSSTGICQCPIPTLSRRVLLIWALMAASTTM